MDPIALSIGMQGDFNVSLDGMKAQLDAERALAGQRIKDREKRQAEIDDIYKTSVDITDPSKYLPVYHDDIRAKTQSFVQEMDEAVKSGEPRMQIMQRVSKLKEDLGAHRMSTDLVMDAAKKGTVPPDVLRAAMDKNGSVALVDAAQRNFQTLVPVTEGGSQILFPEEVKGTFDDTMKGLRTMELNREYDQNGTKTFQIPGSPDRALILENSQTPAQERAAIIDYTVEYLLSPSQAPNTIMKVFGGNSMDLYEAGPNGQGLVLKPENRAKVAQLATEYLNANPHLRSQTTSIYKKDDGGAPRAGVLQTDSYRFNSPQESHVAWASVGKGESDKSLEKIVSVSSSSIQALGAKARPKANINVEAGDIMVDYTSDGNYLKRAGSKMKGQYPKADPVEIRVMAEADGKTARAYAGYAVSANQGKGLDFNLNGDSTGKTASVVYKVLDEEQIETLSAATGASVEKIRQMIADVEKGAISTDKRELSPKGPKSQGAAVKTPASLSAKDKEAYDWAKQNPSDPRSEQILNRLGLQ